VFENILGQKRLVELLQNDIASSTLPASLLFYGEAYSGKLSTALELARVISCEREGEWNCPCRRCQESRSLESPYTVMLGWRYFEEEIAACGDTLLRNPSKAGRYLYIRALRKLISRFDSVLWEGNEGKIKGCAGRIEKLEEQIELLDPHGPEPDRRALDKIVKANSGEVSKLLASLPGKNIPIDQIRNVAYWAKSMSSEQPRFIILEGADMMLESSRNALLKLLEEPPNHCHILLLTSRKGGIIQTILSRVRQYPFSPRGEEESREVLGRIFRVEEEYRNLRHFFLAWKGVRLDRLREAADQLLALVNDENRYDVETLEALVDELSKPEQFEPFLQELSEHFRQMLSDGSASPELIALWNDHLQDAYNKKRSWNQSGALVLESLFYRMAETRYRREYCGA
jgi:DNA polymerase III subunit gamma/tau